MLQFLDHSFRYYYMDTSTRHFLSQAEGDTTGEAREPGPERLEQNLFSWEDVTDGRYFSALLLAVLVQLSLPKQTITFNKVNLMRIWVDEGSGLVTNGAQAFLRWR
jgi:hypothetical protein